jgi:alpha,alpha-trehalose-phosphate synthase [UDP-forming]
MRLSLRLIVLLAAVITLVTLIFTWREVRSEQRAARAELERRAESLTDRFQEAVAPLMRPRALDGLHDIVERFGRRERLIGAAVGDANGQPVAITSALAASLDRPLAAVASCASQEERCGRFVEVGGRTMYVYSAPLVADPGTVNRLITFHDASAAAGARLWGHALSYVVPELLLIVLVTFLVIQSTILSPMAKTARWMKDLQFGKVAPLSSWAKDFLKPISAEAASLAHSLAAARATAENEARLREAGDSLWTSERLRVGMQSRLKGSRLFVVSNREPYEHVRRGSGIETLVPASGLVTALEPVLCACDGTWIAHGSGDADRDVVDDRSRVRVPPEAPKYVLRRVWLTKAEQDGYYFGFANEGLWPLCHIAHARPTFRASDWEQYQRVNQMFAEALLEEIRDTEQPLVLIQDYHFALLPRLIKEKRPDAHVSVFWHIPWPNPEAFGICPWQRELLDGLLGADVVSFHIQAHCDNFLETIDRSLECRVEWERFAITRGNHCTIVRPHPISVAMPEAVEAAPSAAADLEREATRRRFGVDGGFLGVGVDRIDYTKGIIERFRAIECFLEKHPAYHERFTFLQIGAPSRTRIKRYQDLQVEVEAEAERINARFQSDKWKPIVLIRKQLSHQEITPMYNAADLCLVTSLHDGMNLVAKEFVACRGDEDGVLILSRFTGASRELRDALLINPYDIGEVADAITLALEMTREERRARMRRMRQSVKDRNVYRWAADLIAELVEVRPEVAAAPSRPEPGPITIPLDQRRVLVERLEEVS